MRIYDEALQLGQYVHVADDGRITKRVWTVTAINGQDITIGRGKQTRVELLCNLRIPR